MGWREELSTRQHAPGNYVPIEASALEAAAGAELREASVPLLDAQVTFWHELTDFLGRHGRLAYDAPNYDLASFTTGWMALEQPVVNERGETGPTPCIQVTTHENDLIWDHFRKQNGLVRSTMRTVRDPHQKQMRQRHARTIREVYDRKQNATGSKHFPYIELKAHSVVFDGTRKATISKRTGSPMRGAYVPGITVTTQDLGIFPDTPPYNFKPGYGYTKSWVRLGPPKPPETKVLLYHPVVPMESYRAEVAASVAKQVADQVAAIAVLAEFTDIVRTADTVDFSVDDYFERLSH